jgi:drug/metabolite transporter (DMT)-like permease
MAVSSRSTFWLMLFAVSSSSMVVSNKIIMHAFPFPMTLLLIQNTIAVVLTLVLALTSHDAFTMKPWDSKHLITWLLPTITFSIMLMTSLLALPHIAVATTVVFRNLGSLLVATIEPLVLTTPPLTSGHKKSLALIIAGALIYSIFDLNFNQKGYLWISFNTGLFCVQVLIEKYAVSKVDQTATGIACYQNLLSIPVLLAGVMFAGESTAILELQQLSSRMLLLVALSGMFGCSLSVCYMALNQLVSATSMVIAGNLNKLLASVIGAYIFSNSVTPHTVAGLLVCILGGYMYSQAGRNRPEEEVVATGQETEIEALLEEGVETVLDAILPDDEDTKEN